MRLRPKTLGKSTASSSGVLCTSFIHSESSPKSLCRTRIDTMSEVQERRLVIAIDYGTTFTGTTPRSISLTSIIC
jgi:hypothetical protein